VLSKMAFALVAASVLVFAGAAFAAKPSGSSSIAGPYLVTASPTGSPVTAASTTTPHFGDTVTFDVSTQAGNPFVNLICYGNGIGYNSWAAFWPTAGSFVLSSGGWTSGAADCTAKLVMYVNSSKYKVLASTSFHVEA
jgi:hypothetical protein